MSGPDDPEEPQAIAVPRDVLVAWWERVLAGIALALLTGFLLDIILHR
jgi:hypothetical protein